MPYWVCIKYHVYMRNMVTLTVSFFFFRSKSMRSKSIQTWEVWISAFQFNRRTALYLTAEQTGRCENRDNCLQIRFSTDLIGVLTSRFPRVWEVEISDVIKQLKICSPHWKGRFNGFRDRGQWSQFYYVTRPV